MRALELPQAAITTGRPTERRASREGRQVTRRRERGSNFDFDIRWGFLVGSLGDWADPTVVDSRVFARDALYSASVLLDWRTQDRPAPNQSGPDRPLRVQTFGAIAIVTTRKPDVTYVVMAFGKLS